MTNANNMLENTLDVYFHSEKVGVLTRQGNRLRFQYTAAYLAEPQANALSHELPLIPEEHGFSETEAFFSNLLPEGPLRQQIARHLKISDKNTFELLRALGGECAGAVSLYRSGKTPKNTSENKYLECTREILDTLETRPFLVGMNEVRMSGAGAQNKLMVAFPQGKIAVPLENTPSTHILKPPIQHVPDSVENEFFCMRLAKAIGLDVANAYIWAFENRKYYLTQRYDRIFLDEEGKGSVSRLHQEDFCQALGYPPERKYENEGGPTLVDCFGLLDDYIRKGQMPGNAKIKFLQAVIFNYLIGNGDAHSKNFSILYQGQGANFAPLYDLLSSCIYGDATKQKMAMKISGEYQFRRVTMKHFEQLAEAVSMRPEFVRNHVWRIVRDIQPKAVKLATELNASKETHAATYDKIINVIERHIRYLLLSEQLEIPPEK